MDRAISIVILFAVIGSAFLGYQIGARNVEELKKEIALAKDAGEKAEAASNAAQKAINSGLDKQSEELRKELGLINANAEARSASLQSYLGIVDKKITNLAAQKVGIEEKLKKLREQLKTATGDDKKRIEAEIKQLEEQGVQVGTNLQSASCLQAPVDSDALRAANSNQRKGSGELR